MATTDSVTAYWVAEGRGFEEATLLVDADYAGVVVRDGWAAYRCYTAASRQSWLAHLLRRCHHLATDNPS